MGHFLTIKNGRGLAKNVTGLEKVWNKAHNLKGHVFSTFSFFPTNSIWREILWRHQMTYDHHATLHQASLSVVRGRDGMGTRLKTKRNDCWMLLTVSSKNDRKVFYYTSKLQFHRSKSWSTKPNENDSFAIKHKKTPTQPNEVEIINIDVRKKWDKWKHCLQFS